MRPAGHHRGRRGGLARAAIAVAALYGLVLQAFLGGLMPMPAHAEGLICAGLAGDPHDPATGDATHDGVACCTPAATAGTALPARPEAVATVWPPRPETPVAWSAAATARARAPPGSPARARAPPPPERSPAILLG